MSYQQPLLVNVKRARSSWRAYSWSDSAQIAANQEGIVTPEQRNMLDKGPGCLYTLVFLLFILGMFTSLSAIGVALYLVFAGKFAQAPYVGVEVVFIPILTFLLKRVSSVLRHAHDARFTRAVDAFMVGRVQGEVIWEGGKYVARAPGFLLTKTMRSPDLPPPGPYHFYYVTGQNILLSAQPIHTYTQALSQPGTLAATGLAGDEQARLALQMALCSTLGFAPADLDINRLGMLTDGQRQKLSNRVLGSIIGSIIGLVFSGAALSLEAFAVTHGWVIVEAGTWALFFAILILGLFGLGFLAIFLVGLRFLTLGAWKRYDAIAHEEAHYIEGHIKARVVSGGEDSSDSYYYDIGPFSFQVPGSAIKALIGGVRYRVYYLASLKILLSVEALEAPAR